MKQILTLILLSVFSAKAQQNLQFTNPDALLNFAWQNSIALKTGNVQVALAKYQTYYANINRFNPRANVAYAATDNFQLPVNFIPTEIFGGPTGSFKEVKFGQQYIQNISISPQIDLINSAAWAKLKSVKTSEQLSTLNVKLTQKTIAESVVAVYFSVVSLQEQVKILTKTLQNADSVLAIVKQKYSQGIIRSQDVNTATVNQLLIQDRIQQAQNGIEQQYVLLKSLCDIPISSIVTIEHQIKNSENIAIENNTLKVQQADLQVQYAQNELKVNQKSYYPTLSLIGNWAIQENSNQHFFDNNARWFPNSYLGLRLNFVIPDANKLAQSSTVKSNAELANLNLKKQQFLQDTEQEQLRLEYQKARESEAISKKIEYLKNDTYLKNLNLFQQDIYPTENLMNSFTDALNARLNHQVSSILVAFQQAKININNTIK